MACYHPLDGWPAKGGGVTFRRSLAVLNQRVQIACGQCSGCRLERSRQWAVRCMHEKHTTPKCSFVTLTYRDSSLPPRGSLVTKDWQDFAHRLRKRVGPFRFFHCGEYGGKRGRAHLHAIIWGHSFEEDRQYLETTDQGHRLDTSQLLDSIWGHGDRNPIGEVTFKSSAYVARYIMAKQTGKKAELHYGQVVDKATGEVTPYKKPEYVTMSLKPGIGHAWIHKYMDEVYPRDELIIRGKRCRPPTYYDQQYEARRIKEGHANTYNRTTERLRVRETKQELDRRHFKRNKT